MSDATVRANYTLMTTTSTTLDIQKVKNFNFYGVMQNLACSFNFSTGSNYCATAHTCDTIEAPKFKSSQVTLTSPILG